MDEITISTHNGSQVARAHNIRLQSVVSKEPHIDPHGHFEIWHDEEPAVAYNRIFGAALEAYNQKQTKAERRIASYYDHINKDEKKHPVYEMIVGIYGKQADGSPVCSVEDGKAILRRFYESWKERNPNLELIGAYYHADEQGEPHIHLDYVPVATGYKRGLSVQSSISKALQLQGFIAQASQTEQIKWEARENQFLGQLCADMGLLVLHPGSKSHLDTEVFKARKELEQIQTQTATLAQERQELEYSIDYMRNQKSLSSAIAEAYTDEQPVEVIERKPEHKTITGKVIPPLVTITEEDFESLQQRAQVSDWMQRAQQNLKRMGETLLHQLSLKRIVKEYRERAETAEQLMRSFGQQIDRLKVHIQELEQEISDREMFMQLFHDTLGFNCLERYREYTNREYEEREL